MIDPAPTPTTAERDAANRNRYALRRAIRASRADEARLRQEMVRLTAHEEAAKRAIEAGYRAQHWREDPERPWAWRISAVADSQPQPPERVAWQALGRHAVVISADGARVGTVRRVLADAGLDIFDGVVIDTRRGPGGQRFVQAALIASIRHDEIELTVPAATVRDLPRPSRNPGVLEHHAGDPMPSALRLYARRRWHRGTRASRATPASKGSRCNT